MLNDLLLLERFYGQQNSALFIDELMNNYDEHDIRHALNGGLLMQRRICIGPDCGRYLCWLSEKGRERAVTYDA